MPKIILLLFSYLLGSIPFGFLAAYLVRKIDIRKYGSGNIGATNVFRVVGPLWGILVFIFDFLKGLFPLFLAKLFFSGYFFILVGIFAILGHTYPVFLKFKGGKAVATSLGVMIGLSSIFPLLGRITLISIVVWLVIFFLFRYVSLASILSGFSFFIFSLIFPLPKEVKIFSLFVFLFILLRHKRNIKNLLQKKELRF
ncbi:MAG TPA: glycerol-3-phosphate 1-O-acyltransferase PlsY [Candidatus Omnitrophica bacterium]|nr:glycerol-3-phosphate 1-O-acyltransferase PlsY [Candidatus Omnitrophota bacterium]